MAIQMYCSSCAKNIQWRPLKGFAKKKSFVQTSLDRAGPFRLFANFTLAPRIRKRILLLFVRHSVCLSDCLSVFMSVLSHPHSGCAFSSCSRHVQPTDPTNVQTKEEKREREVLRKKKIIENKDSQIASPLCCYVRCMSCVRARCQNCKLCRNEKKHFCEKNLCPVRKDLEKPISNIFLQSQKVLKSILLKHLMENWILFCKAIKVIVIQTFIGSFGFKTHNWMNDNFSIKLTLLSLQ